MTYYLATRGSTIISSGPPVGRPCEPCDGECPKDMDPYMGLLSGPEHMVSIKNSMSLLDTTALILTVANVPPKQFLGGLGFQRDLGMDPLAL